MDKVIIIDAYSRGLLSKDECTQLLGIDPTVLMRDDVRPNNLFQKKFESFPK